MKEGAMGPSKAHHHSTLKKYGVPLITSSLVLMINDTPCHVVRKYRIFIQYFMT